MGETQRLVAGQPNGFCAIDIRGGQFQRVIGVSSVLRLSPKAARNQRERSFTSHTGIPHDRFGNKDHLPTDDRHDAHNGDGMCSCRRRYPENCLRG